MISLEEMNRWVALFGASQKAFMRSERRTSLRSMLFDVPRRSSIGWHCLHAAGVPLLRQVASRVAPEEIARRMRRLCSRPYYLTLSILMCSYFGARQQLLLDAGCAAGEPLPGESPEKVDEARFLVEFWGRCCRAYRNDGALLPALAGDTQPILSESAVAELANGLEPSTRATRHALRRLAASLELYAFILHGEQRDGIFAHGPYPQPDGSVIVVHEFTDLQNDFLPWAATAVGNPYSNLAIVLRLKETVRTRFDLFGGVLYAPSDMSDLVVEEALFTRVEDGGIRRIDVEECTQLQHCAAEAQNELYLKAAEWGPRFKAEYGVHLFANHLRSFFGIAGFEPVWDDRVRQAFQSAGESAIDRMLNRSEPPSLWAFMASTEGDFFWPVVASSNVQASQVG